MDQSTNKTTNENSFTSSVWEKLCSGSCAVSMATNYSMGCMQDGHAVSWCLFWSSVLEKSIEFSFHTFIKSWWINILHLFSAKWHSHKIKSKFSRWLNFPQHKLCLGKVCPHHLWEIRPFCLPVTFNTSFTVTWRNGTCWQLKGMEKCSQQKGGRGKQWNERNLSTL